MTLKTIELVRIGPDTAGEWFNIPGCCMRAALENPEMTMDEVLSRFALPSPRCTGSDVLAMERSDGLVYFFRARPNVIFTVEASLLAEMQARVASGEDAESIIFEFYANSRPEMVEVD